MTSQPITWTIAGSDSGGGAGIQADLKTFHSLGCHGCSAITAITAQNSLRVSQVAPLPVDVLQQQITALAEDLPAAAIKLGMLGSTALAQALVPTLKDHTERGIPLVIDPVLTASSGASLSPHALHDVYQQQLFPLATLITPNVQEAQTLTGITINSAADRVKAAAMLLNSGTQAVIITGGDCADNQDLCQDYFHSAEQQFWLSSPRQPTDHNHGTGCTYASAVTAALARGHRLTDAVVFEKMGIEQGSISRSSVTGSASLPRMPAGESGQTSAWSSPVVAIDSPSPEIEMWRTSG